MDILFVIIFAIINLLPTHTRKCEIYVGKAEKAILSLTSKGNGKWHCQEIGNNKVRKFNITPTSIAEIDPETGKAENQNINNHLDIEAVNWQTVKKINLKETATYLEIQREAKKIILYKKGVEDINEPLIIKY